MQGLIMYMDDSVPIPPKKPILWEKKVAEI